MDLLLPKKLDIERVLKYAQGEKNENLILPLIDKLQPLVFKASNPKVITCSFDNIPSELIFGEDIKKHLDGCFGVLLYLVTLGNDVDTLIRKTKLSGVLEQVVCDAISSVLVEQISEQFEDDLKSQYLKNGEYLTNSYACGYGDYPLSILETQLRLLDSHRKIGVGLTSSGLMSPKKSICAVLGIAKTPKTGFRAGCEHCALQKKCKLYKEGKTCVR